MKNWYEVKVQRLVIDSQGYERKKTELFLLDADNYSDAEKRAFEEMGKISNGFQIKNIKKTNIAQVIETEGDCWFKAKINFFSIDEDSGKEKKINEYVLVMGNKIDSAMANLASGLLYVLVPFSVLSIQSSNIVDVFPKYK